MFSPFPQETDEEPSNLDFDEIFQGKGDSWRETPLQRPRSVSAISKKNYNSEILWIML